MARAIDRYQNCGSVIRLARPQKPCKCMDRIVLIRAACGRTRQETSTTTTMMAVATLTGTTALAKMATMTMLSVMHGGVGT